jgi:hypothetical protein
MMNQLKKHLIEKLALCVASSLFSNGVLACGIAPKQFKGLDTSEYIFIVK